MALHYFDLTLRNPASDRRWLLFTEVFHDEGRDVPALANGDLVEIQLRVLRSEPRAVLLKGVGPNFWAVQLPGGAQVELKSIPIQSWWQSIPQAAEIEVIVATDVRVDGKPLDELLSEETLTRAMTATVSEFGDDLGGEVWHPVDLASAPPVVVETESRASSRVEFSAP